MKGWILVDSMIVYNEWKIDANISSDSNIDDFKSLDQYT
jgi:hypothetical protein